MQQSDEHAPEIDDALKDERHQSSAGTRHTGRSEDPVTEEAVDLRRDVARFLGQAAFPGDAAHVQAVAADNGATDEVRRSLARLVEDRTYESVQDVLDAIDAP